MKKPIGLDEILPGERAVVYELQNESVMRRRLRDLGLVESSEIECLGRSPMGDPSAYLIRGAVIAIRNSDARQVLVVRSQGRGSVWG